MFLHAADYFVSPPYSDFFRALVALVISILVPYSPYVKEWMFGNEEIYFSLLKRILFTSPFIWMAYYQAKKSNQYFRLEQEYAHKEVVSRSFEGYKAQVQEVYKDNTASQALLEKLLGESIETIAHNPAQVLGDGKHHPVEDIAANLNELTKPISELVKATKSTST